MRLLFLDDSGNDSSKIGRSRLELGQLPQAGRQEHRARAVVLRFVSADVRPELVVLAIAWLDERWRGDVFVPDELLPLVTAAQRQQAGYSWMSPVSASWLNAMNGLILIDIQSIGSDASWLELPVIERKAYRSGFVPDELLPLVT